MRLLQHKREAYWFYRYLSVVYENVNKLFWNEPMRAQALELARLDNPGLRVLDVGAGTGFTTEGIVERTVAARVTMLDQSPHQLAVAEQKPSLAEVKKVVGDAERLPFVDDSFERYVSAGSIEYWPDPQRALTEAYRVTAPDGWAVIVGPTPPRARWARFLADLWMLFPSEIDYRYWFEGAGFVELKEHRLDAPWQDGTTDGGYAIAIAGRKPLGGVSARPAPRTADVDAEGEVLLSPFERVHIFGRFVLGSAAGLCFVPVAAFLLARKRWRDRSTR